MCDVCVALRFVFVCVCVWGGGCLCVCVWGEGVCVCVHVCVCVCVLRCVSLRCVCVCVYTVYVCACTAHMHMLCTYYFCKGFCCMCILVRKFNIVRLCYGFWLLCRSGGRNGNKTGMLNILMISIITQA